MTPEEKAKAYDEAIKKAAALYKASEPMSGCNVIIETLFPELKESEDEETRKELIDFAIKANNGVTSILANNYDFNKWIAWLEKQGEQTDIANKEYWRGYREGKQEILDKYAEIEKQGVQKASYTTIAETGNGGINALVTRELPIKMKTAEESLGIDSGTYNKIVDECIFGEQKPADKVEPKFKVGDKIYLKPEYRMPDDDTPIANTVKEIRAIDDKHYRFDGSYIFIEDQDKYELVEQKPAWSEEDERNLQGIIDEIEANKNQAPDYDLATYDRYLSWLKSLKNNNK